MDDITVAVGAVIGDKEGRVLLVKHVPQRDSYWKGKWICPGGRLEFGESIGEGIAREVKEETDLDIRLDALLPPFERIVKQDGETKLHVIYIDSLASLAGGQFRPGSDVGEGMWVSPQELPGMWDQLHEDTRKLLNIAKVV